MGIRGGILGPVPHGEHPLRVRPKTASMASFCSGVISPRIFQYESQRSIISWRRCVNRLRISLNRFSRCANRSSGDMTSACAPFVPGIDIWGGLGDSAVDPVEAPSGSCVGAVPGEGSWYAGTAVGSDGVGAVPTWGLAGAGEVVSADT